MLNLTKFQSPPIVNMFKELKDIIFKELKESVKEINPECSLEGLMLKLKF